jgi:hypothetical protein
MNFIILAVIIIGAVFYIKSCGTPNTPRSKPIINDEYRQQLLEEDRKEAIRRGGGSWRRHN